MLSILWSDLFIMTRVCINREQFQTDERMKTIPDVIWQHHFYYLLFCIVKKQPLPIEFLFSLDSPINTGGFREKNNMYHFAPDQVMISDGPKQTGLLILRHVNANMDWSQETHISKPCSFLLSCKVLESLWKQIIRTGGDIADIL